MQICLCESLAVVLPRPDSDTLKFLHQGGHLCSFCAGQTLYAEEHERILSPSQAKITRRLAQRAARRDRTLAVTYSLSLALAYGILVIDSQGALPRLPFS